ncbi:hypothetical protein ACFOET_20130 [Parapedobacter deserti]|uniref:Methane oxygenase PmoA n=1 Tax=Parapedobacter deserti TaxID=1912957 RepID=A0ABV7JPC6_9SPHI
MAGMKAVVCLVLSVLLGTAVCAQESSNPNWIRPDHRSSDPVWGAKNGIVFSLWPYGVENSGNRYGGGPRGLIRVGYESGGEVHMINFLAIEPVVDGKMEFSEISPSVVDGVWGKLLWAGDTPTPGPYHPSAKTRGTISRIGEGAGAAEELAVFVFMERFANGAAPYLRLSIRSDRPEELCVQVFHHDQSALMDRCAITATMGNYPRLRRLHLKNGVIRSEQLYAGFDGIDFIEKESFPGSEMLEDKAGNRWVFATGNEPIAQLLAWPEDSLAKTKLNWKYRTPFKLTQYWKKEKGDVDPSLVVRVNGRARYWSGGSRDTSHYMPIPGGPSFENFELREKYVAGQKFYYGLTKRTPEEIIKADSL